MQAPKLTPRTKHIAVKYHFSRSYLQRSDEKESKLKFVIKKIDSELQLADIFTKGLSEETFVRLRKLLCGW